MTLIGEEVHEPYDRPPLSKQVLKGWVPAGNTKLPRMRAIDADWRLGIAATGLDRDNREVLLANGDKVPYDRLLIATGVRSRQWFNPEEAKLKGLFTLRTSDDAAELQAALKARPKRVLIVGAGFIGSEMASVCRDLGLDVTVAERSSAPLVGPLGGVIGDIAAKMQRDAGVDLRTGVAVEALKGDADGHVRQAQLSDGTTLDVDVVVASLGSVRNIEWLEGAQLAAGFWGVACDAGCRAFDINGVVTDNIFVAGDIARAPHVLYEYQFMAIEHVDAAVLGAQTAAHNMVSLGTGRRPHLPLPQFWSGQFGVNIKGVGVCSFGDEIVFTQGSVEDLRFAAAYGQQGSHRGSHHLQPWQMAGVLRQTHRTIGALPAPATGLRPAGKRGADVGPLPGSARADGHSRRRSHRPRSRPRGAPSSAPKPAEQPRNGAR